MRETTDPDEIVLARLRAVVAGGVGDESIAGDPTPAARAAPMSPPWAPRAEDRYGADADWPPSAEPGAAELGTAEFDADISDPAFLGRDRSVSVASSPSPLGLGSALTVPSSSVPAALRFASPLSSAVRATPVAGRAPWPEADAPPSADHPPSGEGPAYPPSGEGPASVSLAGAFGSDDARSRRLIPFDPGRRGVRALAAVALLVVLIAAVLAWRARPRVDQVAAPPADPGPAAASAGDPQRGGAAGSSPAAQVVVAVGGKVRKPGLVRLPPGSRVADAIQAAGGADPGMDVASLNLARKVVDGELILVGVTPPPGADPAAGPAGQPAAGGAPAGGPINLNTATLAELDSLPGVGPVLAQRILDAREAQGGFRSVSDLRKVDGIGDSRYEQLKDLVVV